MTDFVYQHSMKLANGDMVNVRADGPEEFEVALEHYTSNGLVEKVVAASLKNTEIWNALAPSKGAQVAVTQLGGTVVSSGPADGGAVPVAQAGGTPGQGAPGQVVADKWGGQWQYGLPQAPPTPRGPAVKATKTSKAGKVFSRWEDPAKGPLWFEARLPKPAEHELYAGDWAR